MSRILCALSGVEFTTQHFSKLYLTSRECSHPIFHTSHSDLLSYSEPWADSSLSQQENYLLYLALFNSTQLVEFRVPAIQTTLTQSIVAQNMQKLFEIVDIMYSIGIERAVNTIGFPRFVISADTKDLSTTKHWIEVWFNHYEDYNTGYKTSTHLEKLSRVELYLERILKDKNKDISHAATNLANWAELAAGFHNDTQIVADGSNNDRPIALNEYWKRIIRQCAKNESIYAIHDGDLSELIDFCEDNIAHGSIYAHALMTVLREAQHRKQNYLNIGDIDIGAQGTVFRILDANASVEDANILAMIDSAPVEAPKPENYPSKLAYLRAKLNWEQAQAYKKSDELRAVHGLKTKNELLAQTKDKITGAMASGKKLEDLL